jgi:predicted PurR-regulated permease PerM
MEPQQSASKVQTWTNRTLLVLFLVTLVLSFQLVRPFLTPLVLASFLVAVLHRPYRWLKTHLGNRRQLSALVAAFAVTVLLVLPAAVLVTMLVNQASVGITRLIRWLGPAGLQQVREGHIPERLQVIVVPVLQTFALDQKELTGYLTQAAAKVSELAPSVVITSVDVLVQLFVLVLSLYYLFADGEALVQWLIRISPLKSGYTRELIDEFYQVAYAMLVGSAAIGVVQGFFAWLIFWLLGISTPLLWALALSLASFVPALGAGLIWGPMALILYLTGEQTHAIILLVYSLVVFVIFTDHLLRPLLVKNRLTMHPLIVFVAIFGGVYFFGMIGLLLGPLVAALLITVLRIYARDLSLRTASQT